MHPPPASQRRSHSRGATLGHGCGRTWAHLVHVMLQEFGEDLRIEVLLVVYGHVCLHSAAQVSSHAADSIFAQRGSTRPSKGGLNLTAHGNHQAQRMP